MLQQILLIEDDFEIARIIKDTLNKEGYHVVLATTGLEGLHDFKQDHFDLVLVDWMMPEMDGLTLIEHIRFESDVPIIMISARNADADKVQGLQGADDYLAKPFSLEELKARVTSQLRRWQRYNKVQQIAEMDVYVQGLKINWATDLVELNDFELALTQKEFALLKVLAQNAGQILTKEQLYLHVWQQSSFMDTNTVTVHIKSLREKLQDPVKTPHFIQTVWGKGYRFIGEIL
ncbi:DNA-binding response regulator [Solibacillus sp. R5-41]|uniref:response regulator transcription factor n=1 Tax=Solibacillus sp. R5-41 TaxID=2048654 RepID=UPI000C12937E|nr:response regulator transcription factor [Solibacillus sp. R5-41]ATP41987.1 DNA-binding response regulator [Solibacillus sp. R5-41]